MKNLVKFLLLSIFLGSSYMLTVLDRLAAISQTAKAYFAAKRAVRNHLSAHPYLYTGSALATGGALGVASGQGFTGTLNAANSAVAGAVVVGVAGAVVAGGYGMHKLQKKIRKKYNELSKAAGKKYNQFNNEGGQWVRGTETNEEVMVHRPIKGEESLKKGEQIDPERPGYKKVPMKVVEPGWIHKTSEGVARVVGKTSNFTAGKGFQWSRHSRPSDETLEEDDVFHDANETLPLIHE
jgi:hypothetical protein